MFVPMNLVSVAPLANHSEEVLEMELNRTHANTTCNSATHTHTHSLSLTRAVDDVLFAESDQTASG